MEPKEKKRLDELVEKKKTSKLDDAEFKEYKELLAKCGKKKMLPKPKFGDPGNDFSWWNKFPELTENAANLKSNWIAGTPLAGLDLPYVVPGVVKIALASCYGSDFESTDPVNVWARDLYLRFFQKWRGVSGYTASDLGITLIAAIEVVKVIAKYERIYGVINRYSRINVNLPKAEEYALGITAAEADYLRSHLSDFRYDLNVLIKKMQRLCIPKDISVVADALSLLAYEYLDHESSKSQIIIFDTVEFGVYQDTALSSGGSIEFRRFDSTNPLFNFNVDNMCVALDTQLQALLGSDSVQKIFADMTLWFGDDAMLTFMPIVDDFIITPVKSESILHKMHNLECQNLPLNVVVSLQLAPADQSVITGSSSQKFIYQVDDKIVTQMSYCMPSSTYSIAVGEPGRYINMSSTIDPTYTISPKVLDTYRAKADPEVIVEGCLFKYYAPIRTDGTSYANLVRSCGFWMVEDVHLISMVGGAATAVSVFNYAITSALASSRAGELAIVDWAPLTYYVDSQTTLEVYGDIDNPILLYGNDLVRLHTTVVYSGLHSGMTVKVN